MLPDSPGAALGAAWALIVGSAIFLYAIAYDSFLKTMPVGDLIINSVVYIIFVLYIIYKVTKKFMADVKQ